MDEKETHAQTPREHVDYIANTWPRTPPHDGMLRLAYALADELTVAESALEGANGRLMELRKWRTEQDCRYTMGDFADISGSHCPIDNPCVRCQHEALQSSLDAAERDAVRYLDAIFKMADDGWLLHGPEGMDEVQTLVHEIACEHPEAKRRIDSALSASAESEDKGGAT